VNDLAWIAVDDAEEWLASSRRFVHRRSDVRRRAPQAASPISTSRRAASTFDLRVIGSDCMVLDIDPICVVTLTNLCGESYAPCSFNSQCCSGICQSFGFGSYGCK
jgi:hypothetical protein